MEKKVRFDTNQYDAEALVARLEAMRTVDVVTGDVVFRGSLFFDDVVTVLERAVLIEGDVPEHDLKSIVYGALFRAATNGPLRAGPLFGEIGRGVQDFLQKSEEEFILATSLSGFPLWCYPPETDGETEISGGCRLYLARNLPERLREGHETAKARIRGYVFGEYPAFTSLRSGYTAVWVSTKGRSVYEAAAKALDALDLWRAIWNFALNRGQWKRYSSERRKPVNWVILGPVHSLHYPDGSLVSETDWYEHDYVEPIPRDMLRQRWDRAARENVEIRKLLAASAYRGEIEVFLRKYTRTLDTREWEQEIKAVDMARDFHHRGEGSS